MIAATICRDDQIGFDTRRSRLDQDMRSSVCPCTAGGVTDNPSHCVTSGNRYEIFARLKGDIADPFGRCIELVERAFDIGVDLDCIDIAVLARLFERRPVRSINGGFGRPCFAFRFLRGYFHQLTGQRQSDRDLQNPNGRFGDFLKKCGLHIRRRWKI